MSWNCFWDQYCRRAGQLLASRRLRSVKNPHFQNEAKCTTLFVKLAFICMRMKNHFHIKGWVLTLVLIQRPAGTWKWPIFSNSPRPLGEIKVNSFLTWRMFIEGWLSWLKKYDLYFVKHPLIGVYTTSLLSRLFFITHFSSLFFLESKEFNILCILNSQFILINTKWKHQEQS